MDETGHFIGAIWDWLSGQSVCSRFDANPGLSPLIWTILIFLLSFIGLGLIVFPYIIPVQITIYKSAAAPVRWYLCWFFIVFFIPIMLAYNIYQHMVFRGKITSSQYGE
ncbi:MAG: hypothetical protein BRC36_06505 [Cyanobacteria bacterium QH_2_48_84]|nr:MAG: hypothetical protein BRC36_06505 [Cyanobacteria bacterium QH_2_48_84]